MVCFFSLSLFPPACTIAACFCLILGFISGQYVDIVGTIMTISKDRVKPSPLPDSWKLAEIFTTGVVLGTYLAMMTVIFFWVAYKTDFFPVCLLRLQSLFLCFMDSNLAFDGFGWLMIYHA